MKFDQHKPHRVILFRTEEVWAYIWLSIIAKWTRVEPYHIIINIMGWRKSHYYSSILKHTITIHCLLKPCHTDSTFSTTLGPQVGDYISILPQIYRLSSFSSSPHYIKGTSSQQWLKCLALINTPHSTRQADAPPRAAGDATFTS